MDILNIVLTVVSIICTVLSILQAQKAKKYKEEAQEAMSSYELLGVAERFHSVYENFYKTTSKPNWNKGKSVSSLISMVTDSLLGLNRVLPRMGSQKKTIEVNVKKLKALFNNEASLFNCNTSTACGYFDAIDKALFAIVEQYKKNVSTQ